jgi:hypothetical protein
MAGIWFPARFGADWTARLARPFLERLFLLPGVIFLLGLASASAASEPTPQLVPGEALSRVLCVACHEYPTPDLHDTNTWRRHVFPLMHRNAGMAEVNPSGTKEEKAALEQWRQVWEYYFAAAPTNALPQGPRPPIRRELKGFTVEDPRYRRGISYATLVKIDPVTQQIYVGNALTRSLDVLDAGGHGQASTRLDTTLTHLLRLPDGDWLGTQVGMVVPDDRPLGRLTRFARPGLRFEPAGDWLTQLVRPIECAVGDLNGDGRSDLVVCSYGNRTGVSGQLAWYAHRGGTNYDEHVLLDRPGATRCYVGDYDRDGRLDIIALMAQAREGIFFFRNEDDGEFAERPLVVASPAWGLVSLQLADFNGDGHFDLLAGNGDLGDFECPPKRYHGVRLYLNDGKLNFREVFFYPQNGTYETKAADFDGDGDLDIAAISFFPDYERSPEESFILLENRGGGSFAASTFPDCERGRWLTMDVGDLEGDGDADIVLGAAFKTPFRAPPALQARWDEEGPSLLILRNQLRPVANAPPSP